jgi:hypothetical protein
MANYFAQLPAYRDPGALDFSGINDAVSGFKDAQRQNVMAEYAAQRNKVADGRAAAQESRAASKFNEEKGKEALNQLGGIWQAIEAAPEAERPALLQRAAPMYNRLRTSIPDFDADAQAMGVDPSDFASMGRLLVGRSQGVQDPLARQQAQANIAETQAKAKYYGERPAGGAGAGGATGALADRLMAENPGMTLEEAITIAKRGNIEDAAAAKKRGEAKATAAVDLPGTRQTAYEAKGLLQSIKSDPYLPNMVGLVGGNTPDILPDAQRVRGKIDQVQGQAFLTAFQKLRGGGQITEVEGNKATQAISRLGARGQELKDYVAAIEDLEKIIDNGVTRAQFMAGEITQEQMDAQLHKFGATLPGPGGAAANPLKAKYGLE